MASDLEQKMSYKEAERMYRKVLKVDVTNAKAKEKSDKLSDLIKILKSSPVKKPSVKQSSSRTDTSYQSST